MDLAKGGSLAYTWSLRRHSLIEFKVYCPIDGENIISNEHLQSYERFKNDSILYLTQTAFHYSLSV